MTTKIAKNITTHSLFQILAVALVAWVTALTAPPASAQPSISGNRVHAVFWGKTFLVHQGPGRWEERPSSGAALAFTFIEVYRNQHEIILHDASRDVDLRIDMKRMAIDYSDAQNPAFRELYRLAGYIDTNRLSHSLPTTPKQSATVHPDLSVTWNSDFGPIHWKQKFYGNPTKVLKGTLRSHGGPQYIFEGFWARTNSSVRGSVLFIFSADGKSFKGTYKASDGSTKTWNGFQ